MLPPQLLLFAGCALFGGCALVTEGQLADRMDLDDDGVPRPDDCDDNDPGVGGKTEQYRDEDEDGYGTGEPISSCSAVAGYVPDGTDCNDTDPLVLDEAACVPESCGVGTWGNVEVDDATIHVDGAGLHAGDGSITEPFLSVQEGVDEAAARGGATVVIAAGSYLENVRLTNEHDGVSILGRCKELVTIDGSAGEQLPTLDVAGAAPGPSVGIQGVTITGGTERGIYVEDAALTVTACDLTGNTSAGLLAYGLANVSLDAVAVSETASGSRGNDGFGLLVEQGATLRATGCSLVANTAVGVYAHGTGTVVVLDDTTVEDTVPGPDGTGGEGLVASQGASLTATGCTVTGNVEAGAAAFDAGTTLQLDNSTVVDTSATPDGEFGYGILVADGAALAAARCTIQRNVNVGVAALDAGTEVTLDAVLVLDTEPAPDGKGGYGLAISEGARLTASMSTVQGNTGIGVIASGDGTLVELYDSVVIETARGRNTSFAVGVAAQEGAEVIGSNLDSSDNDGPGIYACAAASVACTECDLSRDAFAGALVTDGTLSLASCTIDDTVPGSELGGGFGVYAASDFGFPSLSLSDSAVGPHPYAAVWLDGNGRYDVQRNELSGSEGVAQGTGLMHGNAVFAQRGVAVSDGTSGLLLLDNTYSGASIIAVLLDASSATLDGGAWSANGTDVWQQHCDGTVPLTDTELIGVPSTRICPSSNILTAYDITFGGLHLPEVDSPQ